MIPGELPLDGKLIAALINASGYSKAEVSRQLGVSKNTVGRWMEGANRPKPKHQERLRVLLRARPGCEGEFDKVIQDKLAQLGRRSAAPASSGPAPSSSPPMRLVRRIAHYRRTDKTTAEVKAHTDEQAQKVTATVNANTDEKAKQVNAHTDEQAQKVTATVNANTDEKAKQVTAEVNANTDEKAKQVTATVNANTDEKAQQVTAEVRKGRRHQTVVAVAIALFVVASALAPRVVYVNGPEGSGLARGGGMAGEALGMESWRPPSFLGYMTGQTGQKKAPPELFVPDHPFPHQKLPPCDPSLHEQVMGGGCWTPIDTAPPCGRLYRSGNKCYRPIAEDPLKPVQPSEEPRRADPWVPAKEP